MSASYAAVGWNRQKKIYDSWIFICCLLFLSVFTVITVLYNPRYTFETLLIRSTGTLGVLLLHIILAIGPLARLNKKYLPLLYNRRHLGVTMFIMAFVHGGFSIFQFHALGNVNAFVSLFTSNTQYNSVAQFPFQSLGFLALIILLLMAVTSHDFWLHNLSPKTWKTLHMLVYIAYLLIVLHVMLGVIQYETNPFFVVMTTIGAISLIVLHLAAGVREVKNDNQVFNLKQDGFFFVCNLQEIQEGRAKVFCIDKERIAIYKHEGKLFALHNVCKHQGGPLGEGKILDGCVTCPWHGYQYLPANGGSPPPFKEKVSTYDVRVYNEKVWLNPTAYPERTERPGAISQQYSN